MREESHWLLENCVFTHYITLCHIRGHGDFVVCYKTVKCNLYVNIPCKGFLVFFFSTSHKRYPQSEPNKQNDRSHSNEKTHVCKVAGGKMKKLSCINVFRFCARNMRVFLLEQTKMYGPSPLVLNMLISYLFPCAWDGSYRGITEMRAGRRNL